MSDPSRSILIIAPDQLGESCLAVPAVRAFVAHFGNEDVYVVSTSYLADLWRREVFNVIVTGKSFSCRATETALAGRKFAMVLNFNEREVLKFWDDPERLFVLKGAHKKAQGQVIPFHNPRRNIHHVERYMAFPRHFDLATTNPDFFPQLLSKEHRGTFMVHMNSNLGRAYYEGLAQIPELLEYPVDRKKTMVFSYDIEEGGKPTYESETITERLTLSELMESLLKVDFLLAPECNLIHLAAYLGVPTVAIFGPGNLLETRPLGRFHQVVQKKVECQPCISSSCLLDQRCTTGIQKEDIEQAVQTLLSKRG